MAKKKLLWLVVALAVTITVIILVFFRKPESQTSLLHDLVTAKPEILADPTFEKMESAGKLRSYGDGFSGLGYIDQTQTDMFLDYNVTGFSFPPVYELKKESVEAKGGKKAGSGLCLGSGESQKCLKIKDNNLYLDGGLVAWPPELKSEHILSVNAAVLNNAAESKWIVGIVTGAKTDERGWVYFFNGLNFDPLITKTTAEKIEPQYNRLGGKIYFSDNLDDFLIYYSGYDGRAFYSHQGELTDVSRFFGLRVTSGGFPAQIVSTSNSRGSVFYVCSNNDTKFRLIKLWSRAPGELIGALDFSSLVNVPKSWTNGCRIDASATSSQAIKVDFGFKLATSTETWSFLDRGFDSSHNWQIVSKDLAQGENKTIVAADFNKIALYDDSASSSAPVSELFLANRQNNWQEALPHNWYRFSEPTQELYWRAIFNPKAGDPDYSPWFDSINELLYKTVD